MTQIVLDAVATQAGFAGMIGISRQAVAKHLDNGVLARGGSYRQWLLSYCSRMSQGADNRGGSKQDRLTRARTMVANANADGLQLSNERALSSVVFADDVSPLVLAFLDRFEQALVSAFENALHELEPKCPGIELSEFIGPLQALLASFRSDSLFVIATEPV